MQMLQGLAILLTLQSMGEALSRLLHLPYPGPVIGMVLLLIALRWPAVQVRVRSVADFLLAHLSLLFVPVGVGVITQLDVLAHYGLRLAVVLVLSTWSLRSFPPLSQRCALRAGGRRPCCGAALARWPLAWARRVLCAVGSATHHGKRISSSAPTDRETP